MVEEKDVQKPKYLTSARNQYIATIAANCIVFAHGCMLGWASPAIPKLISPGTPLASGPLSVVEVSWIGSINCVGALLGSFTFGYFITLMGCKRAMLFITIPAMAFWFLIYFGNLYVHILLARFFSGWAGGGIQTTIILYVAEIANDDIRGRLGSITLVVRNIGILIGYILGALLDYHYIPCVCIVFPVIYAISFILLPNTPRFYLHKGQTQRAENALKFYKGYKGGNEEEDNAIYKEFERLKAIVGERKTEKKLQLSDFCNGSALKGLGIGISLQLFAQFTGCFTITSYAVTILNKTGTSLDAYTSSIMLAIGLILGASFTTYLADKLGRKILNLVSLMGSAVGLFATALYHYLNLSGYDLSSYAWIPVVSLSFVIFISSIGIMPLSFICSVEYLPAKVRVIGMAIVAFAANIIMFVFVKVFPIILEMIGLHWCMIIFGTGSIVGFIFVLLVLKETTGQSLDDVGMDEKTRMQRGEITRLSL